MLPSDFEEIPPGAELASVLDSLDWSQLSDHDLIRAMQAQQRQISHYQAGLSWSMNEVTRRYQRPYREDSFDFHEAQQGAAAEIGCALHLTRRAAESETGFSVALVRWRPKVFEAMLFGRIDTRRARILVEATLQVSEPVAAAMIDELLDTAATLTTSQLRAKTRKVIIDADPDAALDRYVSSIGDRRVVVQANDSGTANLCGLDIAPQDAVSIKRYLASGGTQAQEQR